MLPAEIENLIHEYVDSMCEGCSLPSMLSIKSLIRRSDIFVMNNLGFVMGLPTTDLVRLRCRIVLNNEFLFYFRLSLGQKVRFIRLLKRGIVSNHPTSCLVWVFLQRGLINYPSYKRLFLQSLLVKFLIFFSARDSIVDRIV